MSSQSASSRLILAFTLIGLLSIGLLWLFGWPVSGSQAVAADTPATLGFAPSAPIVAVGQAVSVQVRISDIADLYGADVRVKFDPQVLQVKDANPDAGGIQVAPGNAPQPDFLVRCVADNQAGTIWYAATSVSPTLPFSGTGVVVTIVFRGQAEGTSMIEFTYHKLVQRTGLPCDYVVGSSGLVRVLPVTNTPTPTVTRTATVTRTPTSTATPTPTVTPGAKPTRLFVPLILRNRVHL